MKRVLLWCGLLALAGCLQPLQSVDGGSGATSVSATTVSSTTSTVSSTGTIGTSVHEGCGTGSYKCCDELDCFCLLYCPICDSNNIRRCETGSHGDECFCIQGGNGTIGTGTGVTGFTSSGGASGSIGSSGTYGSTGFSSAAASSSGSSFAASSAAASSGSGATTGTTGGSGTGSTTGGVCARLGTVCNSGSDCCSTFCDGTCTACPAGNGQCGTTGTTGI